MKVVDGLPVVVVVVVVVGSELPELDGSVSVSPKIEGQAPRRRTRGASASVRVIS